MGISYCADDGHFKCLTHMLEMFMVKVTFEGRVPLHHVQKT